MVLGRYLVFGLSCLVGTVACILDFAAGKTRGCHVESLRIKSAAVLRMAG